MMGPHHSIICAFTGTGHGAAAWMASCIDETSYCSRVSSGSFSIRTNIVGTHWLWVTWYRSIAAMAASASKRSMMIAVAPIRFMATQNCSGAEWYSGAGDRYTVL